MSKYDWNDDGCLIYAVGILVAATIAVAVTWFAVYNESATYNRLTGANTTAWDALWVELRVQDTPKERTP